MTLRCLGLVALLLAAAPAFAQDELPRQPGEEQSGFDNANVDLVAQAEDHLAELLNRPVLGVSVETVGRRWQSKPAIGSVALGTPLTGEIARAAMRELLDTGEFAQVYADARPYQDGAILRLVAVPRRIVAQLSSEGGGVSAARVRAAIGIAAGSEITESSLREARSRVLEVYRRHGYARARVTITTRDTDDPMKVLVDVAVEPGEARRISRRIFVVEPAYHRLLGEIEQSYRIGAGDVADEDDLSEADNDFAELLKKRDFLQANIRHRVLRRGPHVFLYVYLATGPQYRFRFEQARAFDANELKDALELDKASEPSAAALADRIAAYYQKRGYLDVRVVPGEESEDDGAARRITFEIHEGDPVRVTERRFPCLPDDPPKGLRAKDLGDEIDATLEEELPGRSILAAVDETIADDAMSPGGKRAPSRRPAPASVYQPESYKHALEHVAQLLHAKGYLNAVVGPVTVVRARCDPKKAGACRPLPLPPLPDPQCRTDALDLPLPEPELGDAFTCAPDPRHGVRCAPTIVLSLPVHLGPETRLWDVVFEGSEKREPRELLAISQLNLGDPLSQLEIDAARTRIQNAYADDGYYYATVRADVEYSPDRTRARARFTVVEHEPVVITGYDVRGALRTDEGLVLSRLALCKDLDKCSESERTFKRQLVRDSEEQIGTLGTFSSVSISLEDADIPQRNKRVIISVVEQPAQYFEPQFGFLTGEGFRFAFEYGHRNLAGKAIGLTIRLVLGYLPDFLIADADVRANYEKFLSNLSERLERRNSISLRFPEIGLGPKFTLNVDGIDVRDNQRDYGLSREALLPLLTYRPLRQWTFQLGSSVEVNDVTVFQEGGIKALIQSNPATAAILRVPEGRTLALAQRLSATWDRRDNPFAATSGTFLTAAVEHVTALPLNDTATFKSEFLRLTARGAGYIRLTDKGLSIALSVAGGYNAQLRPNDPDYATYPDRLFYLGGFSNLRGFGLDSVVPEDIAQQVLVKQISIGDVSVRGGNFYWNPRAELRIPMTDTFSLGVFLDSGNVWSDPKSIANAADFFTLRYASGAGLRAATPVGPIAFDGGFNLIRRPWEDVGAIHFSIGLF